LQGIALTPVDAFSCVHTPLPVESCLMNNAINLRF